jgi:hypothetical protein
MFIQHQQEGTTQSSNLNIQTKQPESGNRDQSPNSSKRLKRLEFVQRHYSGLQECRKSRRRCIRRTSRPTCLRAANHLGKMARTAPQCHVPEIDTALTVDSAAKSGSATRRRPKQRGHLVERETNRDHESHTRLRHTGWKRWQRLRALNHRENLLVEYGCPGAALDVPR